MPVPLTPPYLQFFDSTGAPLTNGTVDTYAATTSTRKATYTDVSGSTVAPNPIQLNASGIPQTGNGMIFIQGAYRIVVKDQFGNVVDDQPSITSFSSTTASTSPFFQSFSGTGSQTAFTLSTNLGTDPNGLMIFVAEPKTGFFQKFSGTGSQTVFTLSTAKGTDSSSLVVFVYNAAAADKLGFEVQNPSTYTINGTTLTFSSAPVSGTDNIYVMQPTQQSTTGIAGYISPSLYTVNGTTLTFTTAPVSGTNNIMVTAPSTLAGQAAVSAAAADASATAAANSATSASGYATAAQAFAQAKNKWIYSSNTTMADPTTGKVRFNNATFSSVTAIALSNNSSDSGNPDLSGWTSTWDDAAGSTRGSIYIFKDNANFIIYNINSANTDNTGWKQLAVNYLTSAGSFSDADTLYFGFTSNGSVTVTGGITALTGDVTASGSGSVAATIANNAVTTAKINNNAVTLAKLATQAGNTVLAEATGSTAVPTAVALSTQQVLGRLGGNITGVTVGTSANNLVQLDGSAKLPAVDGSQLTNIPSSFVFLGPQTASNSAALAFTSKITSSYDAYYFVFKDIRPATNAQSLQMTTSTDNGSTYNASNNCYGLQKEARLDGIVTTSTNTAWGAGPAHLLMPAHSGNATNETITGELWFYNPNSTVSGKRVKSLLYYTDSAGATPFECEQLSQTSLTTAINALKFSMSSGNITSGTIYMYGIKNS